MLILSINWSAWYQHSEDLWSFMVTQIYFLFMWGVSLKLNLFEHLIGSFILTNEIECVISNVVLAFLSTKSVKLLPREGKF